MPGRICAILNLYCFSLARMAGADLSGPAGFLHLPYTTTQVARFLREAPESGDAAPMTPRLLPGLPPETQAKALEQTLFGPVSVRSSMTTLRARDRRIDRTQKNAESLPRRPATSIYLPPSR